MTTYAVQRDEIGVHEKTLTANTEMIVTFPYSIRQIEIENVTGTGRIYYTTNGDEAVVAGPRCRAIPAALHAVVAERETSGPTTPTRVRLISSADTVVSVTRL